MKRPPKSRCLSASHSAGTPSRPPTTLLVLLSWIPTNHYGEVGSGRAGSLPWPQAPETGPCFTLACPLVYGKVPAPEGIGADSREIIVRQITNIQWFCNRETKSGKHWLQNASSQEQTKREENYTKELFKIEKDINETAKIETSSFKSKKSPQDWLFQFSFLSPQTPEKCVL